MTSTRTPDLVAVAAARWPERTALAFGDRRWTFRQLEAASARHAAVLCRRGVKAGDLVRRDADGYIFMVERSKELIKRSGFNVLPGEVEAVIHRVPGVVEVAVVGVPDERHGQRVKAFVVPDAGRGPSRDAILAACRERLARYKIPEEIEFIRELPKGPTGKIKKKLLREADARAR